MHSAAKLQQKTTTPLSPPCELTVGQFFAGQV
jgi:hypothetical protein